MQVQKKTNFMSQNVHEILFGSAIASLLLMNALPLPYSLIAIIIPALYAALVVFNIFLRQDLRDGIWCAIVRPSGWTITLLLVIASMVYGIARSSVPFRDLTYFEIAVGFACLGLSIWADANFRCGALDRRRIIYFCGVAVVAVSAVFGVVAMFKYVSLGRGWLWSTINVGDGEVYPWGTSLRQDSNLFTIPFIASFVFLAAFVLAKAQRSWPVIVLAGLLAALDIYVGINAASRRFLFLICLASILVILMSLVYSSMARAVYASRVVVFAAVSVVGYAAIDLSVSSLSSWAISPVGVVDVVAPVSDVVVPTSDVVAPASAEAPPPLLPLHPDVGNIENSGGEVSQPAIPNPTAHLPLESMPSEMTAGQEALAHEAPPTVVSGNNRLATIADGSLFDTRIVYWQEAWKMLEDGAWLFGMGYDYQSELACRVATCASFDYPHSFFLSHALAAGLFGLLASFAAFSVIGARTVRNILSESPLDRAVGIVVLVVAGYALFSGDTIFSLPVFCALPILAQMSRWRSVPDFRLRAT